MGNARDYFDALAESWDSNPAHRERAQCIAEAIRSAIPLHKGMRIMDYGCGTGLLARALAGDVGEIVAIDTSPKMLAKLREKLAGAGLQHIEVVAHDLSQAPWPGPPFDLIVSSMTLHHVVEAGLVVARLAEALRPGGWLAIADLDAGSEAFHSAQAAAPHAGFSAEAIQQMFAAAGLHNNRTQEIMRVTREGHEFAILLTIGQRR